MSNDFRRIRIGKLAASMYRCATAKRQLRLVQELLELYEEEAFRVHAYFEEAYKFGYRAALELGDFDAAKHLAERGFRSSQISHGPNHPDTKEWQESASIWA